MADHRDTDDINQLPASKSGNEKLRLSFRKAAKEIIKAIAIFVGAVFSYSTLITAIIGLISGISFRELLGEIKITWVLITTTYDPFIFWLLTLVVGLPAVSVSYLARLFYGKWIFLLLPFFALFITLMGTLVHYLNFREELLSYPYPHLAANFILLFAFQLIFSLVVAFKQRWRNRFLRAEGEEKMRSAESKTRFVSAFLLIIIVGFGLIVFWSDQSKQKNRELLEEASRIEREYRAMEEKRAADTYGGKTPQETLKLYIDAVEKGDYELASKYFILEEQENWKRELEELRAMGKISVFLGPLKEAVSSSEGGYSFSGNKFYIDEPIAVDFILYPSGVWKITKI